MRVKVRETKKTIRNKCNFILGIGSDNLQHLLKYRRPFAYSDRVEGWACDYYSMDGFIISTGYSPIKTRGIKISDKKTQEVVKKYEDMSRELVGFNPRSEDLENKLEDLITRFENEINELIK